VFENGTFDIHCTPRPISGSGRRRPRGEGFCDGKRGSFSIRYAVLKLIAACAADAGFFSIWISCTASSGDR
jgi:hypothetical protein